jgi:hypothetical protein
MDSALNAFIGNLDRVRAMHALHQTLAGMVAPIIDLSDLLRAEIVLTVSALDQFVHEITRLGMMQIWKGTRTSTPAYLKFQVSMDVTGKLIGHAGADAHLDAEIRLRHGYRSFQEPDNIADAIRLISPVELWNEIGSDLAEEPKDIKARLKLLVERRNKIAHEADVQPPYPGQRWPISRQNVEEAIVFVERIGRGIHKKVS